MIHEKLLRTLSDICILHNYDTAKHECLYCGCVQEDNMEAGLVRVGTALHDPECALVEVWEEHGSPEMPTSKVLEASFLKAIQDTAFIENTNASLIIYHVILDCGHMKELLLDRRPRPGALTRCRQCEIKA